ncbi:M48 family metallopeptidase [Candidatus Woesebacteria bacterium]|nr:M48 family metallopeptidase [Candidatus Woesebacteria bacterium]MCD8527591.1 M48 family metallopeptidase [Candidatus Woesebacteria bacterium]MCD8546437.1 M48 family metallopeptidase [Candidatus Woesebacteria bacterium]
MEKESSKSGKVEVWMFRVPNEHFAFILTLIIIVIISILLSIFDIYVFILLFIGVIVYVNLQQAQYLGNAIRVHPKQYPKIFYSFRDKAERLGIRQASLYITQDPYLQAFTLGITNCTVVLTSAIVEQLTEKELDFVIAHELGHYAAGHTKLSTLFVPIGNSNVLSGLILGFWNRKAEFSCDRCGLILTKDIDSSISALIKLAVGEKLYKDLDIKGYIAQIKTANRTSVKFSELLGSHPLITNRIKNLMIFWKENFRTVNINNIE